VRNGEELVCLDVSEPAGAEPAVSEPAVSEPAVSEPAGESTP
jgi:hypothetical protein